MKVVVFLGAGFSRAWGLPVMREFFEYAKDADFINDKAKKFLRDLQLLAQRGSNMLQTEHDNLEDILSFCLASQRFNAGYAQQNDDSYANLCRVLHDVYRHLDRANWSRKAGLLKKLVKLLGLGKGDVKPSLTILTTNYDVVIETALANLDTDTVCTLPCQWSPVQSDTAEGFLYVKEANGPHAPLCKLHGSVNWFVDPRDGHLTVENALVRDGFIDDENDKIRFWLPMVGYTRYTATAVPLILPPTLFKIQAASCFREILTAAGNALHNAERLVFIGFGFPESDTYVRYFLAANLSENTDIRSIDIVDPKAKEICDKLKSDQFKFGNYFTFRLRAFPARWEEADYSVID